MRVIHTLVRWFFYALLLAEAAFAVYATMFDQPRWSQLLQLAKDEWFLAFFGGLVVLLLMLIYVLTFTRKKVPSKNISFDGPNGRVTISVKAVRDFVQRVSAEFSELVSVQPTLEYEGKGLHIDLEVRVIDGTSLPELSQALQERVIERLNEQLGLKSVKSVKVNVREIVDRPPVYTKTEGETSL
ncbi:MAG: alkaline shock response membrane anchor protein AmaP [Spartobacteria bacterium]|nr:alkaline shock response membrane anchor protein AmaP [Spartobacteria bacterium]